MHSVIPFLLFFFVFIHKLFLIPMFQAYRDSIRHQISEGAQQLASSKGTSEQAFALIIDGKSLTYALEDNMKGMFLDLAIHCSSVICCRSSPKQKALVSRNHLLFVLIPIIILVNF